MYQNAISAQRPTATCAVAPIAGGRPAQCEDIVLVEQLRVGLLLAVADGTSHRARSGAGRAAAAMAIAVLAGELGRGVALAEAFSTADVAIAGAAIEGRSTLSAALIEGGRITAASVGDSEIWSISRDEVVELSRRQDTARLGDSPRISTVVLADLPEFLVLMSDGVHRKVGIERVASLLMSGRSGAQDIIDEVARAGLADDAGAVVVRCR